MVFMKLINMGSYPNMKIKWIKAETPHTDGWYTIKYNYGDEYGEHEGVDIFTNGEWCDKRPVTHFFGPLDTEDDADYYVYT